MHRRSSPTGGTSAAPREARLSASPSDRSLADEATRRVLDRMGLAVYLFALEPAADEWIIELEHPRAGAWRRVVLRTPAAELYASIDDPARRDALARAFRAALARADAA